MDPVFVPLGLAAALVVAAILLRGQKALFWFAFLLPFFPVEYIDRYHTRLPTVLKWSPLLGTLLAGVSAALFLPQVKLRVPARVLRAMLAVIAFSALSMVLNGTPIGAFAVAQRGWIVAVAAMMAFKSAYSLYSREDLHAFLVRMGLLSSLVSLLQRLIVVPNVSGPDPADRVTGLFSVGYIQLYFHLFCIGIQMSYWLSGQRLLPQSPLLVVSVLVLSLAVGNEKASLPYLVLLVIFSIWRNGLRASLRSSWKPLSIMLLMPVVLLAGFAAVNDPSDADEEHFYANQITDPAYVRRYMFGDGDTRFTSGGALRRGAALVFAYDEIADEPLQLLCGAGAGETAESRLPGSSGRMAARNPGYNINRLSLSMTLGDTGLLGLLLNVAFLATVWFARSPGEPPHHARVRETFVFMAAAFAVYANMTNEAIYCFLMAVVLYPLGARRIAENRA